MNFIERAKSVHGDKYDYSLVEYKNSKTKVKIKCPVHGWFEQTPEHHLHTKGCSKCGRGVLTTEQFIEKAKLIHGDEYDYSLVDYKDNETKVKIKCEEHGVFEQRPSDHLAGCGCSKCANNAVSTTEEFIEKAKLVHKDDDYDYSFVEYKNKRTKVKIKCKEHGIFEQTPNNHLLGYGCAECANNIKYTTEQFIEKAKLVHGNKYDYSLVVYENSKSKVKIKCEKHGVFEQFASSHMSGVGCPGCHSSHGETKIANYLQKNNIIFETQKTYQDLKDKECLSYDFYLPDKNLLIEFNGEQHYNSKAFNKTYKEFLVQKHHDWLKRKYAEDNKINLLVIPYWEFDNIEENLNEL